MTADLESLASGRLLLAFACMLLVTGITNTFPVFFPPLLAEFGGSRAATVATITLMWAGGAVFGPLAGWAVARWNPRAVVMMGLAAATLGFGVGTVARSLPLFYGRRRSRRRDRRGADRHGDPGGASRRRLRPPARRRHGDRARRDDGRLRACATLPVGDHAFRLAGGPRRICRGGRRLDSAGLGGPADAAAPRRRPGGAPPAIVGSAPFWLLLLVFTMPPIFGGLATTQHTLYLTERGFSVDAASAMLGIGGVLAATGRVLFGLMADRLGAPLAGFVSFGSTFLGLACLLGLEAWPTRIMASGYVLFLFVSMGSRATIGSVLVGRIAAPADYGVVFGLLGIGNSLGSALGPLLAGALHDWTGSYLVIYLSAIALTGVAVTALAMLCLATRRGPA